jgi:hypothetical protein
MSAQFAPIILGRGHRGRLDTLVTFCAPRPLPAALDGGVGLIAVILSTIAFVILAMVNVDPS